jgi:hypothetical protein
MASNYLEQLAAEWYEFNGYFIRRNVHVGKLPGGGYECELDVVGFNPQTKHLVHVEPSMDADSWAEREKRLDKKFQAGRKYIPGLFKGFQLPTKIEQIALFGFAGKKHPPTCGGGKVVVVQELLPRDHSGAPGHEYSIQRYLRAVSDPPDTPVHHRLPR